MSDTPETDNNDYAYTFLEQYGHESSLQGSPVDWADFARRLEIERDMLKSELSEWKILRSWGGTPEIIHQFIKGQQMRIYAAQEVETDLQAERTLADRLADAAKAVIDQWETPNWKLTEPTAAHMNTLRNTITAWKEARSE